MKYYTRHPKYFVAVDCVILGYNEGELCLLLYPRGFEPSKGAWSLMGGFVQDDTVLLAESEGMLQRIEGEFD